MTTQTPIDEVIQFLGIAEKQGFLNTNTAQGRRTACSKLLSVLEDEEQRTVEYVRDNLELIKTRFQHLNNDVRGQTVDEYVRRVALSLDDFTKWKTDRGAWERDIVARGTRASGGDAEKRARPEKAKPAATAKTAPSEDANTRVVRIPLPSGVEVSVTVPRDLSVSDLRRILWALLPYASDWNPDAASPQQVFPMLEDRDSRVHP